MLASPQPRRPPRTPSSCRWEAPCTSAHSAHHGARRATRLVRGGQAMAVAGGRALARTGWLTCGSCSPPGFGLEAGTRAATGLASSDAHALLTTCRFCRPSVCPCALLNLRWAPDELELAAAAAEEAARARELHWLREARVARAQPAEGRVVAVGRDAGGRSASGSTERRAARGAGRQALPHLRRRQLEVTVGHLRRQRGCSERAARAERAQRGQRGRGEGSEGAARMCHSAYYTVQGTLLRAMRRAT